ncbi:MAG: hypothetical protein IKR69_01430 [Bacteroidales bacterium]|nr:hypothetical protein [Bacteroidales bacterium]
MRKAYKIPLMRVKDLMTERNFLASIFNPEAPAKGSDMDIEPIEPGLWG